MFVAPYDMPPWRPPSEAYSVLIRVTRGCPWNRCAFCAMYKDIKFQVKSLEEIERDLEAALQVYGPEVSTVFIGDSDSLVTKVDFMVEVLGLIKRYFPTLSRITSYTRGRTLANRSLEDLERLRGAGLDRLHVGLETGDSWLLKYIRKGLTPEEMMRGGEKAIKAGFQLSLYVLLGIGGEDRWEEHALGTARVLNRVSPHFIRLRTFIPIPGTLMHERIQRGEFVLAPPLTVLKETRLMLENLDCTSMFLSDHVSNYAYIEGRLPHDKEEMLRDLDRIIAQLEASPYLLKVLRDRHRSAHL
ncbi:MAG TPA: radical SAM protein [Thermosulfidibacter takaii]|uniref:Radical SAM protein n=1 Tax=Thermosulfidibacter takaii TaxID=412593 RepID=A0A7C0Y668_9BACT|nr:radical SAM protein [Thermosulfidibacter takaii]